MSETIRQQNKAGTQNFYLRKKKFQIFIANRLYVNSFFLKEKNNLQSDYWFLLQNTPNLVFSRRSVCKTKRYIN